MSNLVAVAYPDESTARARDRLGRRGRIEAMVTGLDYAIHQHAKVINCSFGSSSKSSALEDAVKSAERLE